MTQQQPHPSPAPPSVTAARDPSIAYLVLMGLVVSTIALATDLMLPAMGIIGEAFALADMNDTAFMVSYFFAGFAVGQLFVGPLSDSFGRKPVIIIGYIVFIIGCVMSGLAPTWDILLAGRVLQGLGAAAPRVVAVAVVRDEFSGRMMARVMSFIMTVFILIPALAPALGQGLLYVGGWRWAFMGLIIVAIPTLIWFIISIPETLPMARRLPLKWGDIGRSVVTICRLRVTVGYTLAMGLMFGLFVGYLSTAQLIFQVGFGVGEWFAVYFGLAALSIGGASLVNARLVMALGMRRLTFWSTALVCLFSTGLLAWMLVVGMAAVTLTIFMCWLMLVFFFIGITFGNLASLAMEPLGDMAGLGSGFVGSVSTLISLPLGAVVAAHFDGTVLSLVLGFAGLSFIALLVELWTNRGTASAPAS